MIDRLHGYFRREKETMSKKKREASLKEKLSQILTYGYRHSKAIRSRFDEIGRTPQEVRNLEDLEKLPITKKSDLVAFQKQTPPFGGFEVTPRKGLRGLYMSPGSVFEPGGEWDYE